MVIGLIAAAAVFVAAAAVLIFLLWENHSEKAKSMNKKIILSGGKNVNPDAVTDGDGIIGRDWSRENTIIRRTSGK